MRIRTRSLVILLGELAHHGATLLLTVVLVRIVTQETFGTYRQVLLVSTTFFALLSLQLESTLYYFIPRARGNGRRKTALQTAVLSASLSGIAGVAMFATAGPVAAFFENDQLARPLRIFSLFPLADGLTLLTPAFMASLDRAVRASVYGMLRAIIRLIVVLPGFLLGAELERILLGLVGATLVLALIGLFDMARLGSGPSHGNEYAPWQTQVRYAVPLWLTSMAGMLNLQYDKILISAAFDPAAYAVYFCGALQIPIAALVNRSLGPATMPNLVVLADSERRREALHLWQESTRKASLALLPSFGLFLVLSQDLMVLLYGPGYAAAAGPFSVYLFLLPLRVAVFATLFRAFGRTRPVAVGSAISLMTNVLISTTLVYAAAGSTLSFIGPSIGTVVANFAAAAYLTVGLCKLTNTGIGQVIRWRELGSLFVLSCASGFLVHILPFQSLALSTRLICKGIVYGALFLAGLLGFALLQDDEKRIARDVIRTIRRVLRRTGA